jgi:hypothetical protein
MTSTDQPEESPTSNHALDDNDETADDGLKTLKYSLLGPSLLKAGQDKVDQSKVPLPISCSQLSLTIQSLGFRNHLQCLQRLKVLQP